MSLSPKTIQVVKATAPVIRAVGVDITRNFYPIMFKNSPEVKNQFNLANQAKGLQPLSLANTVFAAAENIDNLGALLPAVEAIAHKHCALMVTPPQYDIVGSNLLKGIKMTLGDAATPEIMDAWAEAYGVIAQVFIDVEKKVYDEVASVPGGWRGWREFTVDHVVDESGDAKSFFLKPRDGGALPVYKPGQYTTVCLTPPGSEFTAMRHYSLSDAPGGDLFRITIKREDGVGGDPHGVVSSLLHKGAAVGDTLLLAPPHGTFTLNTESTSPVMLLSAGIGVTPLVSMAKAAVAAGRPVTFVHGVLDEELQSIASHLDEIHQAAPAGVRVVVAHEKPGAPGTVHAPAAAAHIPTLVTDALIQHNLPGAPADVEAYLCGPTPFMRMASDALVAAGVAEARIFHETFGPSIPLHADQSVKCPFIHEATGEQQQAAQ